MPSVYVETTIPSYLTAWPSNHLVRAAHQAITREWWSQRRFEFELFISDLVIAEISDGDVVAARMRLESVEALRVLPMTSDVRMIAQQLVSLGLVPEKATADALHIGYAAVHKMDYLLTWNCRHIANAERLPDVEKFLDAHGFQAPKVCTPEELMGDDYEIES